MRALIIRPPWIDHILAGRKTWEIRSRATKVRGTIALIRGGSGLVVGTAELVESLGPFTFERLRDRQDMHAVPEADLLPFMRRYKDQAHAWVLDRVVAFKQPIPYDHPPGAVIWVTLPKVLAPIDACRRGSAEREVNNRGLACHETVHIRRGEFSEQEPHSLEDLEDRAQRE